MALKILSNVSHNGVIVKTGDIVDGFSGEEQQGLIARGLAEVVADAPTHNLKEGDTSGRALPLDPTVSTEPTPAEIAAENAAKQQAIDQAEAEAARAAQAQVDASQRIQDGGQEHQPTPAEIAATAANIQ